MARGATPFECLAELMSKATGLNKAKGGSMHLTKADRGMLGSYAIVGSHLPIAAGAAWSAKLRGTDQVAVAFFGDGATNIGAFHEALNLASVWKLPVLFVCENNFYMEYTPIRTVTSVANPAADRAAANGLPSQVDRRKRRGEGLRGACARSQRARAGEGPTVIEAQTYRHYGHSRADPAKYRPADEVAHWLQRDPLDVARGRLTELGVSESDVGLADERAAQWSSRPLPMPRRPPTPTPTEALTDVWADGGAAWRTDDLSRGCRRGHRPRDAARPDAWCCLGRGHRCGRGRLQDDGRAVHGVRAPARLGHPDLRAGHRRRGARRRDDRAPSSRGDHVLRLPGVLLRLSGQRDSEDALHDRRAGHRAAGHSYGQRRRAGLRRAALASGGELGVHRPWPEDRGAVDAGGRRRADGVSDPQRRPRRLLRAQGLVRQQG